jgi:hypothetical protein
MKNDLVNALKEKGEYNFLIEVRKNGNEFTMRNDSIELEENDSKDPDIQQQLDEYMSNNKVVKISLNNSVVWEAPKVRIIRTDGIERSL